MEQNDDIAYKTWVENLQEPAPEGAWNAIADQLDIDAAWNGISETLDLDDVWHNVETELPQAVTVSNPTPTHLPKLFWLAAALVLLTLTTPLTEDKAGSAQTSSSHAAEVQIEDQSEEKVDDNAANNNVRQADANTVAKSEIKVLPHSKPETVTGFSTKSNTEPVSKIIDKQERNDEKAKTSIVRNSAQSPIKSNIEQHITNETSAQTALQPVIIADSISKQSEVQLVKERAIEKLKPQIISDTLAITEEKFQSDSIPKVAAVEQKKDSVQRNTSERATWYVGIIGSLKNTWLVNPETANGLKREALNDTRLTFGKEFGVTLQRSIGGMSNVQFEYYFYSEIGQRYHEYINALYQTKDVRLRYQKFQVLYRTRIFRNIQATAFYATGGIRVSRLTLADTSIGDESQEVTQEYRPWDYGFILGTEAEFKLTNKVMLVSGLRGSYGLRNIYLGTSQSPAEFNKTRTASVGLVLGLKYRIN